MSISKLKEDLDELEIARQEEIENRLKEDIKEFIEFLDSQESTRDIPEIEISVPEKGKFSRKSVSYPSELLRKYDEAALKTFQETACWLVEEDVGFGFEERDKKSLRIDGYIETIRMMAYRIMDYLGEIEFDEDVFDLVFKKKWIENRHHRISRRRSLLPLLGVEFQRKCYEFEDDVLSQFDHIESAEIRKLRPEEMAGLKTFEYLREGVEENFQYVIDLEIKGKMKDILHFEISNAIRILFPGKDIKFGPELSVKKGPFYAREQIFEVDIVGNSKNGNVRFRASPDHRKLEIDGKGNFDLEDLRELSNFFLLFVEAYREDKLPLGRYKRLHDDSRIEDKIIDFMIALESTMLKDSSNSSRYEASRRSLVLLTEYNPYLSYYLMFDVYKARNSIIHEDKEFEEISFENSNHHGLEDEKDLESALRAFLSKILQFYVEKLDDRDDDIADINTDLIRPQITKSLIEGSRMTGFQEEDKF